MFAMTVYSINNLVLSVHNKELLHTLELLLRCDFAGDKNRASWLCVFTMEKRTVCPTSRLHKGFARVEKVLYLLMIKEL